MAEHELSSKTLLNERSQTQITTYYTIPFIWNVQRGQIIDIKYKLVIA